MTLLDSKERIDNIGFGGLRLIQKPEDFCYGIDGVLLAEFAAKIGKRQERIIDLGTGTGIVPIILSQKTKAKEIYGVEIQKDSYERGIRNIKLNKLEHMMQFVNCNVSELKEELKGKFQMVTANPPYIKFGGGIVNDISPKAIARNEIYGGLEDFIKAADFLLDERGELFMVHRPSRIADIMCTARKYKLEPKTIRFVSPRREEAPNILLIHCIKNAGEEVKTMKNLYVYNDDGAYSDEIQQIYERYSDNHTDID